MISKKQIGCSNPVFVIGVFRSGTSLLYSLLNQHPEMAFMYECDVWSFPKAFSKLRFNGNWLERQEFYNQALSRHRLIFGNSLRGLEEIKTPGDLYRAFGDGKGAALWGEKSPFYCFRMVELAKRHPRASFVLIWRDPVEIYRSVLLAGRKSQFFRRRGTFSRLIYYQEKMIEQAAELERMGARVHHVTYADLIDNTTQVCRDICKFLGVEFDPAMLDISHADLSAVYHAPQHDHLRRGVIERQSIGETIVPPARLAKLERFSTRWSRLNERWLPAKVDAASRREPSWFERVLHKTTGAAFCSWDETKRLMFEFLPLSWLRTYRGTMRWLSAPQVAKGASVGFFNQIKTNLMTIVGAYGFLIGLIVVHNVCDPRFTLLPFYVIPCAALSLVINWRWGTVAALISAAIGPMLLGKADVNFSDPGLLVWNSAMRFLLLEVIVFLLNRVRLEIAHSSAQKS